MNKRLTLTLRVKEDTRHNLRILAALLGTTMGMALDRVTREELERMREPERRQEEAKA